MQIEIAILRAKVELFIEAIPDNPNASTLRNMFLGPLNEMELSKRISRSRLRAVDRGLERFISLISVREQRVIRRQLADRFGSPLMEGNYFMIVERIIERGSIVDEDEAEIARSFLSNLQNERIVGVENFDKLSVVLDQAGF